MNQNGNGISRLRSWADEIVAALEGLGGSGRYEEIYAQIESSREVSGQWKAVVRDTIQKHSSDSSSFSRGTGRDLFFSVNGLGKGAWGLKDWAESTPEAVDLPDAEDGVTLPEGNEKPERIVSQCYRILRDTAIARQVKLLHRDICQICGEPLMLDAGETYSEAHHIIPLGKHAGPDTPENIIVLCPNHHALCDYGAIELVLSDLRTVDGHEISVESIEYHNRNIYQNVTGGDFI